jgi:hypothetical protein
MSKFVYKEQVLDLVVDTADIIRTIGRGVENKTIDTQSALHNLSSALSKMEKASEYLRKA